MIIKKIEQIVTESNDVFELFEDGIGLDPTGKEIPILKSIGKVRLSDLVKQKESLNAQLDIIDEKIKLIEGL